MRSLHTFCLFASLLIALGLPVSGQVIQLEDATRRNEGIIPIALESSDANIRDLSVRAFRLHGAYYVTDAGKASFAVRIERASGSSVLLTIRSGGQELYRSTVPGRDLQNAVLRACDLTVDGTGKKRGLKGFFAGKLAFVGKQRGVSEIYTSDLLFSRVTPLTADRALVTGPKWAPDGNSLVYTTYYKSGFPDIYKLDLRAGRKVPIATFKGTNNGACYSRDGRRIAMTLSGTGNSEIFVCDSYGKNARRLTTNRSLEASPSWSPDGRRLVYTSDAPGSPQLYEISANGGPARRIPTNISNYCSEPVWNPVHDNLIAFTASVAGGFQIALYDAKTRSSKWVTQGGNSSLEPTWLNDGRHLVYTQRQGGRTRLMLLDTETGKSVALHKPNFGDASSASFVY
ncbi:hypothetical protein [Coraliomargarita parva]|uniref:hypothetical protein n=1 Tax=Coraliomargarita parva TaxID=3014050 RepID=UPI0022B49EAE|nr:hypothetical protein [Coraliomargarita parva]